jgi:hypothetical protein
MSNIATTWNELLNSVDYLVKNQLLTEGQIRKILDIVNIRTLVTYNKLNQKFIDNVIAPNIEYDCDNILDNDDKNIIKLNEIYKLQKELKDKEKIE